MKFSALTTVPPASDAAARSSAEREALIEAWAEIFELELRGSQALEHGEAEQPHDQRATP